MDKKLLKKAISLAAEGMNRGGGPFGAIITRDGKIISRESNRVTLDNDPTAHAEILAIRSAAHQLGTWDLSGCELYTSCEPCPMCLGAVYWSGIRKVYYAATHNDARDAGFDDADMYHEFSLPEGERMIETRSDCREEVLEIFREWNAKENKKPY